MMMEAFYRFNTLEVIAKMDVNQSSECNEIDEMLEYI